MLENVFDRACLLQLQVRVWQGLKMVEPSVMARLGESSWLKGRKHLVDPDHLAGVKAVVNRARALLRKEALPFPMDGLTLVPRDTIGQIEPRLQELRADFWHAVQDFADRYQQCRREAELVLGELFSETDYPEDITRRFGFEWRYVQLTLPGRSRLLSAELYERERQKFVDLMETTRTEAMAALRGEFAGLVGHLVARLAPENGARPKVLRSSMVEKLEEFLEGFSQRNLFQDDALADLVGQARLVLQGVDIAALRDSEALKQRVHQDMTALCQAVDASLEELPRRRILMAA